jgi:dTMP kinase
VAASVVSGVAMPARYLAFEGGDFSGKSTQARRLAEDLGAVLTREPGGTAIGGLIRGVLLDPTHTALADRAEALLYAADRAQHHAEVIRPALAAGRHVVSDRSAWSSVVYQGVARGLGDEVRRVNDWAIGGRWPDVVVLLDVDPVEAARRLTRDPDRLELAGDDFHQRVRQGYLDLAAADLDHWVVVDAGLDPEETAVAVRDGLAARLGA